MLNSKQIRQEIDLVGSLRRVSQAYEEISVMKMRQIREGVLQTRDFLEGLSGIFYDVKNFYARQIKELMEQKKITEFAQLSTLNKNGKSVSVLLTANTKLYGDIIIKTFELFRSAVEKDPSDVVVVGKLGRDIVRNRLPQCNFKYFEFPDMNATVEDLRSVVALLTQYKTVKIYFGKFENVINQYPEVTDISGNRPLQAEFNTKNEKVHFLFEPKVEDVLAFFETQVFSSLFKQTVSEGQLARFASRINAMEEALVNIDQKTEELRAMQLRLKKFIENKRQQNAMAGISLWQ